jgi:hypothetical protein
MRRRILGSDDGWAEGSFGDDNVDPPEESVSTENDGNCFPFFLKSLPFLFLSFRRDAFLLRSMDAWIRSGRRF